jgi:hypothetical protein
VHGLLLDVLGKVNGDAGDLRQGVTMLLLLLPRNTSPHGMNTYLELKIEAVNEILEENEGVPTLINEYRVSVGNQAWGRRTGGRGRIRSACNCRAS